MYMCTIIYTQESQEKFLLLISCASGNEEQFMLSHS